ncbi:unnamed protein product [Tilletia caries]|nr:hypothetical protein CF335_g1925 [Tilletia laevis]CAD6892933.1 unnamed protein product [Tilletia caries]CAD6962801.1 unnamed protein product [Tilletia caries]
MGSSRMNIDVTEATTSRQVSRSPAASCQLSRLPPEILIHILKKVSPRDVLHFGLTCEGFWQIAIDPQLWRSLHDRTADPLSSHLSPDPRRTLLRPRDKAADSNRAQTTSRKGKEKMSIESQPTIPDEWQSWTSLTLARHNAARQLAFFSAIEPSQILLGMYGETIAILVGMLETRSASVSPSETATTLQLDLFPASALGRHRFRWWIFPRELPKQRLLKDGEQEEYGSTARKKRKVIGQPAVTEGEDDPKRDGATHGLNELAKRINSFSTKQLAAELHCLHGPLYSTQRDVLEAAFWQQLCDPRDPRAPPLKAKSPLLRLLNEQPRSAARPCSAEELMAAQMRIYDSGNFGHANQWGPLRPWIASRSALDPSLAEATSISPQEPPESSSPAASETMDGEVSPIGNASAALGVLDPDEGDEAEEDDPDFVPAGDWDDVTDDADAGSDFDPGFNGDFLEASSRRSIIVNQKLRERQKAGQLSKAIDWELLEATMLCMHANIEDAKRMRGWGLHLPTALYVPPNGTSSALETIATMQERRDMEAPAGTMDIDGPVTRRRRQSLMDATMEMHYDPLKIPTGWNKSHGPDPRHEPSANPRDWAGVEGVWIGTYAFQDFPTFCDYQTALVRDIKLELLDADVVGDCLQLCLKILPEGELLPPADEEICAQPPDGDTDGYELLPEPGGIGDAELLPPLRLQGPAVQYTHSGQAVRRSTIYGMVRPVYGYVSSMRDAGRSPLGEDVLDQGDSEHGAKGKASGEAEGAASSKADSTPSRRLVIKGFHWNLCHRYLNANSWSLSGIQPGGLGSRLPILGIWTDADRGAAQPNGPWLYYRIGERHWEDVEKELESSGSSRH